jgi:drug/metabolite transporter (DMT)-like permease
MGDGSVARNVGDNVADDSSNSQVAQNVTSNSTKHQVTSEAKPSRSVLITGLLGALASVTYISLSAAMILFNKFLMRAEVFPFPVALTSLHMLCALCLASILQSVCPVLFPAYPRLFGKSNMTSDIDGPVSGGIMGTLRAFLPFVPIALCGATCLICGNAAYRHANVAFLQMIKESHIMFVYMLMLLFGLEQLKARIALVITFVTCSAVVAVYGEIFFSWQGLVLQLVSGLAGSMQIVLNNLLMAGSSFGKVDPLTMVLCTAPVTLFAMLPVNVFFWDPRIVIQFRQLLPVLAANSVLAFGLQVSAATLIWLTSGTGYALACVAKDLTIVIAAGVVLQESFTWIQICGFAGSVAGMALYSAMKLAPEAFEPKPCK